MEVLISVDFTYEPRRDWTGYTPDRLQSFSPPCRIEKTVNNVVKNDRPRMLFSEAELTDQASMSYAYDNGLLLQMRSRDVTVEPDTATFGVWIELPADLAAQSITVSADYDWVSFGQATGPDGNPLTYMGHVAAYVTKTGLLDFSPKRPFFDYTTIAGGGQQFAFNTLDQTPDRWFGTRLNGPSDGYYDEADVWQRVNYQWVKFDSATTGLQSIGDLGPVLDPSLPEEAAPSNAIGTFNLRFSIENSANTPHNKAPVTFDLSQSRQVPPDNIWRKIWDFRNFSPPERSCYAKNFDNDVQDARFAGVVIQTTTMNYGDPPWSNGPVGVRLKTITVTCRDAGLWPRDRILKFAFLGFGLVVFLYALQIALNPKACGAVNDLPGCSLISYRGQ